MDWAYLVAHARTRMQRDIGAWIVQMDEELDLLDDIRNVWGSPRELIEYLEDIQDNLNLFEGGLHRFPGHWLVAFRRERRSIEFELIELFTQIGFPLELPMGRVIPDTRRSLDDYGRRIETDQRGFANAQGARGRDGMPSPAVPRGATAAYNPFGQEDEKAAPIAPRQRHRENSGIAAPEPHDGQTDAHERNPLIASQPQETETVAPGRSRIPHHENRATEAASPDRPRRRHRRDRQARAPHRGESRRRGRQRDHTAQENISSSHGDVIPPLGTPTADPIVLLDEEDVPSYVFHLTDANPHPSTINRVRVARQAAATRRKQIGGDYFAVAKAALLSNNKKLVEVGKSKRGEIYATDVGRDDLLEVMKELGEAVGPDEMQWRLLGVGTTISEGRLFLLRFDPAAKQA